MTDAERRLWRVLRRQQLKGFKFRRQAAIENYIVDFVCFSNKLVIELDGGQHNEASAIEYDRVRTQWLASRGFRVLRFWNHDVLKRLDGIVDVIWKALTKVASAPISPPSPTLPAEGRESE
ncbi:MAG: endonuclease domain-containing protein [Planctomycetes bacterium]|nr:endonuclease domain-containing protein [Planctomycetota bacterium]